VGNSNRFVARTSPGATAETFYLSLSFMSAGMIADPAAKPKLTGRLAGKIAAG